MEVLTGSRGLFYNDNIIVMGDPRLRGGVVRHDQWREVHARRSK